MPELIQHLYGCVESDIETVANSLVDALSLSLESHDSAYWGDYYLDKSRRLAELRLYRNADPLYQTGNDPVEDQWFEPKHRDRATLLSVYGSVEDIAAFQKSLTAALPMFKLLRDPATGTKN